MHYTLYLTAISLHRLTSDDTPPEPLHPQPLRVPADIKFHQVSSTGCGHSPYHVPRNLSIVDTFGTQLAVLYREVPLIQR